MLISLPQLSNPTKPSIPFGKNLKGVEGKIREIYISDMRKTLSPGSKVFQGSMSSSWRMRKGKSSTEGWSCAVLAWWPSEYWARSRKVKCTRAFQFLESRIPREFVFHNKEGDTFRSTGFALSVTEKAFQCCCSKTLDLSCYGQGGP